MNVTNLESIVRDPNIKTLMTTVPLLVVLILIAVILYPSETSMCTVNSLFTEDLYKCLASKTYLRINE